MPKRTPIYILPNTPSESNGFRGFEDRDGGLMYLFVWFIVISIWLNLSGRANYDISYDNENGSYRDIDILQIGLS